MSVDSWTAHLNGILYGIQFDRVLDEAVVTRIADGVAGGSYPGGRTETLAAITAALRYPGRIADLVDAAHSEESIRDFLGRLSTALAARA